jgi:hypothetical protein
VVTATAMRFFMVLPPGCGDATRRRNCDRTSTDHKDVVFIGRM